MNFVKIMTTFHFVLWFIRLQSKRERDSFIFRRRLLFNMIRFVYISASVSDDFGKCIILSICTIGNELCFAIVVRTTASLIIRQNNFINVRALH